MIREAGRRIVLWSLLGLAMLILAAVLPVAILFGRRGYIDEAGSAASCMLNAVTGGPRSVTYSAWSWDRLQHGKPWGACRVWVIDRLNLTPGHCRTAWDDHCRRRLVGPDRVI